MSQTFKILTDSGDRYEGRWQSADFIVTVSIDKDVVNDDSNSLLQAIHDSLERILESSQEYFLKNRSRFGIEYIDDLTDPQIMLGRDCYSVYWWSDKGEINGACVIGVDFRSDTREPFALTIGD